MNTDIFVEIELKLIQIMEMIEHQEDFPMLLKDVKEYVGDDEKRMRLCSIYTEVSNLRNF